METHSMTPSFWWIKNVINHDTTRPDEDIQVMSSVLRLGIGGA